MPSFLVGQPYASGATPLVSGNFWSGRQPPTGGIQVRLAPNASGNCYVAFSGGATLTSGGFFMSGGGVLDGMVLAPGDAFLVPPSRCFVNSGSLSIFVSFDAACSGQSRIYWDTLG